MHRPALFYERQELFAKWGAGLQLFNNGDAQMKNNLFPFSNFALLVILALLLYGCGDSGSSNSPEEISDNPEQVIPLSSSEQPASSDNADISDSGTSAENGDSSSSSFSSSSTESSDSQETSSSSSVISSSSEKFICNGTEYDPEDRACVSGMLKGKCGDQIFETSKYWCNKSKNELIPLFACCGGPSINSCDASLRYVSNVKMCDSRDKKLYWISVIGKKVWMTENLNFRYLQGTDELDSSSFCYGDDPGNCEDGYGRLYTWSAAMDSAGLYSTSGKGCGNGAVCSPTYPVRGICPEGWHLPTKDDFDSLVLQTYENYDYFAEKHADEYPEFDYYYKTHDDAFIYSVIYLEAGYFLKSRDGWNDYNGEDGNGDNTYHFNALPTGDGYHNHGRGNQANFWGAPDDEGAASALNIARNHQTHVWSEFKGFEYAVRCVMD